MPGTPGPARSLTAGTAAMYLIAGIKAGPTGAAETLQLDYLRVAQAR